MVYVFSCQKFNWQTWLSPTHLVAICVWSEVVQLRVSTTSFANFHCLSFLRSEIVFAAPAIDTEEVESDRHHTESTITAPPAAWAWGRRGGRRTGRTGLPTAL